MNIFYDEYIKNSGYNRAVIDKLTIGNVHIQNNNIEGISSPINKDDLVNNKYLLNKYGILKNIIEVTISKNYTYDPVIIINGYIRRYIKKNISDKFSNFSDIIEYVKQYDTNMFECIVQNMSDKYTLTIDINSDKIVLQPLTILNLKLIVIDNNIDIIKEISFNTNNIYIDSTINITNKLKVSNNFSLRSKHYNITTNGIYLPEYMFNTIITRTTLGGSDYFPTYNDLILYNKSSLPNLSFNTIIRNATIENIYIYYSENILFNFISPFLLEKNKAVVFLTTYSDGKFIVNLVQINLFK